MGMVAATIGPLRVIGECCSTDAVKQSVVFSSGVASAWQKLPTDPVGDTTVTFQGVVAGSEIRVYYTDGSDAAGAESCVENQSLLWTVYPPGSQYNTVTIRIVHPDYKIKEFTYTSVLGNQSIPVQMERDKWYSNQA